MGDHHDFINSGSWWKVSSSSSSMRANSIESGGSAVFHDKLHHHDHHSLATDHHLQMIGLGLSSQSPIDQWNQSLLRGDSKAETSFGVMLQENLNLDTTSNANANTNTTSSTTSYQLQESDSSHHQPLWRDQQINNNDFKPQLNMMSSNRGFLLDRHFSPHGSSSTDSSTVTCQGFSVDNSSNTLYGTATPNSSSAMFHHHQHQGAGFNLPGSSDQQPSRNHQQSNLGYSQFGSSTGNYDQMATTALPSTWFLRSSPPKPHSPLRFSNNATFWNPAATEGNMGPTHHDASSNFFPALQPQQIHAPSFDEQPKIRDSSSSEVKKVGGGHQPAAKRAKSEAGSPSPAFKVRKEKMGDRIAALQQLVSPFGKTDAASVLSEAIEYIKFLHQQVSALSNPYMKSGASLQHQQSDYPKEIEVSEEPDLRSRGLCLVPASSTFPVTHDTTVDFWTPTFGGTFR